jgi:tetratricopeptide (TPR) repeat protein
MGHHRFRVAAVLLLISSFCISEELTLPEYIDSISPPQAMRGVGNSHLEITTSSAKAQQFFDQGVSLLHDFWWFEAYRSFLYASQLDPGAAMPHWGLFMAATNMANLTAEERRQILDRAIESIDSLGENASARERFYLDAITQLHRVDGEAGVAAHNAQLLALLNQHPDQIEARLFLWQKLDTGFHADGSPKPEQLYGQLLLEREFDQHGDHQGLLHYWIHNQEPGPQPESALGAAKRLAKLAPNSGHIVHMPGHIHYLMGNYDQAHKQFMKAEQADARYIADNNIEPIFAWNYLHNFSFIMSNLAEAGRYAEGAAYAEKIAHLTETSSYQHLPHFEMLLGRAIREQAFMAMRLEDYEGARLLLEDPRWDNWKKSDRLKTSNMAYLTYSAGMAAAAQRDAAAAERHSRKLDSILWRARRDETNLGYRSLPLEIAALELQGMVAHAKGEDELSVELLKRASSMEAQIEYGEPRSNIHPAAESLARVQLALGQFSAARESLESVLGQRPAAGMPLFGIARSYELAGDTAETRKAYKRFLQAWKSADNDRPQKQHAQAWLDDH